MGLMQTLIHALALTMNRNIESGPVDQANSSPEEYGRREERIESEILMIAPRFSENGGEGIIYDEEHGDWLIIPRYPLPERWRARWCKLLILFPEAYPQTPPIGFYLNKRFRLRSGEEDEHLVGKGYYEAPDLTEQGWYWNSVRIQEGGWQPLAD